MRRLVPLATMVALMGIVQPAAGQGKRASRPLTEMRVIVSVDAGVQAADRRFTDRISFDEALEPGTIVSRYRTRTGPIVEGGALVRLWKGLGAGLAISVYDKTATDDLDGRVPHPFFFDQPRSFSGTAAVGRRETAVHLRAAWSHAMTRSLLVTGFAGPSRIAVAQDLVSDVKYTDVYPYDSVTFNSAVVRTVRASRVGFNVGGEVSYRLTNHIGIGATIGVVGGRVPLHIDGRTVRVKAGGPRGGGGVRLLF